MNINPGLSPIHPRYQLYYIIMFYSANLNVNTCTKTDSYLLFWFGSTA